MARKRYSAKFKFQVILEALSGEKTPGQIAKPYGIHPNSVGLWKKQYLEKGPELFAEDNTVQQYPGLAPGQASGASPISSSCWAIKRWRSRCYR